MVPEYLGSVPGSTNDFNYSFERCLFKNDLLMLDSGQNISQKYQHDQSILVKYILKCK